MTKRKGRTRTTSKASAPVREVIKSYLEGNPASKVGMKFGITDYDVLSILRANDVHIRTSREARSTPLKGESFAERFPNRIKLWDVDQNSPVSPSDVKGGSGRKFWWKCDEVADHTWFQSVAVVASGHGCPFCSGNKISKNTSLAAKEPELCKLFDTKRNKVKPENLMPNSTQKVWWIGKCEHSWESSPNVMVTAFRRSGPDSGCPQCAGKIVTPGKSFADLFPEQVKFWDYSRNVDFLPNEVLPQSAKKYFWKCDLHSSHTWQAAASSMSKSKGCPFCMNRRLDRKTNSLSVTSKDMAKQWHKTKNFPLTPSQITVGYSKPVWWKCSKGKDHIWKQSPKVRKHANVGCPYCSGIKISETNCLKAENPQVAKQWIATRNLPLTPLNVRQNSKHRVWWQCPIDKRHKYQARISARFAGHGECPYCTLSPRSKTEIYIDFELRQFFNVTPNKHVIPINGNNYRCDILLESDKVVIEYDGRYWHRNSEKKDFDKADALRAAGWRVIRIRESPLQKTSPTDVEVPADNLKEAVDAVIRQLINLGIKPRLNPETYFQSKKLKKLDEANAYIAKRLKERALRRAKEEKLKRASS